MKRVALVLAFIAIAAFLVIGSLSNTAQAAPPTLDTGVKNRPGSPSELALPAAPNVVLVDQYSSILNNYIVSANRTDNPIASAEAADDFVVDVDVIVARATHVCEQRREIVTVEEAGGGGQTAR